LPSKLSIILVAYQSGEHLAHTLPVLKTLDESIECEIIVVNNFPEEDLGGLCKRFDAKLITPGENLGFGRGVNLGYSQSSGDIILVCNPDATPQTGAISIALNFLDKHDEAGIICPKLIYPDGSHQQSARRFYTWNAALYARSPFRNDDDPPGYFREYMMTDEDFSYTRDIDWAIGAAMFITRKLAEEMGGIIFDPRYFLYFEDVDLCYTCWRLGYSVVYLPDAVFVHHYERKSKKSPLSKANMHHLVSFVKFVAKHGGLPSRPESEAE